MLDTPHKKKSLVITIILHLLLLLLLFFFGLTYLAPTAEQGISINFGIAEVGSGKIQPLEPIKSNPQSENKAKDDSKISETAKKIKEEFVEEKSEVLPESSEEVVTQDNNIEAPVIENKKKKKSETISDIKKEATKKAENFKKPEQESEKVEKSKPVEKKPDASTKSVLNSFLKGPKSEGTKTGGDGNEDQLGDKGDPSGQMVSESYYKNGKGLDGDGNYRLGGRKALNKEKNIPVCNETGTVVVKIIVDQNGKVIQALPGIKGTTNTAACLMDPAKKAALATKFNSDSDAPSKQIGTIIYTFKLSE